MISDDESSGLLEAAIVATSAMLALDLNGNPQEDLLGAIEGEMSTLMNVDPHHVIATFACLVRFALETGEAAAEVGRPVDRDTLWRLTCDRVWRNYGTKHDHDHA